MDPQEDLTDMDLTVTVQLPGGQETTATVHGSKPVMDVLVMLCAQHRLIPSDHVIKLISANQNHIHFKPNSLIGSLEFEKVVLQTKGSDDDKRKKPHMPVATVRLLINYKKSHKAVVRVNPIVPLADLLPLVCEKCEFNPETTILLGTCQSEDPLDLTKTLTDYGIRELYAKDTKVVSVNHSSDRVSTKDGDEEHKTPVKEKNKREKSNKGFFGLFKKSKKTSGQVLSVSAPGSPEVNGRHAVRETCINGHSTEPAAPEDMRKKRRAPRPPLMTSQSVSCEPHTKDFPEVSKRNASKKQGLFSRISSTESSLKRNKRRAPPPPCDGSSPSDADNKENVDEDDNSSDKYSTRITDRCPAIAEVMTELMKSLQARQQKTRSLQTSAQEDSSGPSECSAPEAEFKASPGCRLMRNSCDKEGLTTFTVVPQNRRWFGVELSLQAPDTAEAEAKLDPSDPEDLEIHSKEPAEAEAKLDPSDPEDLEIHSKEPAEEVVQTEHCRNDGNALDNRKNLSEILQHLENENKVCKMENLEQKYEEASIQPKNIKQEGQQSFQRGFNHLECSEVQDTCSNNLQLSDKPGESPNDPHIEERQEVVELALVETSKEKNWIEEYKERRRKFLSAADDGKRKLDAWDRMTKGFNKTQMEAVDDHFPSPPPPVYWYEDNSEDENKSDMKMDVDTDARDTDMDRRLNVEGHFNQDAALNSNSIYEHYTQFSEKTKTQTDPEANTSGDDYSCILNPPVTSLTSRPNPSESRSSSDHGSPETVSLFALAVFQKAKHSRPGPDASRFKSKR